MNPDEIEGLYKRCRKRLIRTYLRWWWCGNEADAEDRVNEVFEKVVAGNLQFETEEEFYRKAVTVAYRKSIDDFRRDHRKIKPQHPNLEKCQVEREWEPWLVFDGEDNADHGPKDGDDPNDLAVRYDMQKTLDMVRKVIGDIQNALSDNPLQVRMFQLMIDYREGSREDGNMSEHGTHMKHYIVTTLKNEYSDLSKNRLSNRYATLQQRIRRLSTSLSSCVEFENIYKKNFAEAWYGNERGGSGRRNGLGGQS